MKAETRTLTDKLQPDSRARASARKVLAKFQPPEQIKLSDWCERECYLPAEAGGIPGPYRLSVTPFHREILDCIGDRRYDRITWMAAAQVGKTTLLLMAAHYFMTEDPSPQLFLEPNESLAKDLSDQRFRGYQRDNRKLKTLLSDQESKSNITEKIYPGGYLKFGSSQTLTDLISRPIRILFMDEVSSYPFNLKDKGNPISLAVARTASSFRDSRKVITTSTPGIEGMCNVSEAYGKSDQRIYQVPCPFCSEYLEFELSGLEWEKGSEGSGAYYKCPNCASKILDSHKQWMLANGQWVITNPEVTDHAGFKLNGMYSPFVTFEDIAVRYRAAKLKAGKMFNDYSDLIEFYNQTLCQTWNDQHLSNTGTHDLEARKEYYAAEVPAGCGLLLAGVDIQRDRAEISVLGFGKLNQIYLINHYILYGDPNIDPDLPTGTLWKEMDVLLNKPFKHQSGRDVYIRSAFVDAGDGQTTQQVRKYCHQRSSRGIFATRGSRMPTDPAFPGKKFKDQRTGRYAGFELGVVSVKDDIHHRLQISLPDAGGYIHFPNYTNISDDYFKQLTSESVIHKQNSKGVMQRFWQTKYKNVRNEALDCMGMAICCKHYFMIGKPADIIEELVDTLGVSDVEPEIPVDLSTEPDPLPVPVAKPVAPVPVNRMAPRFMTPRKAF